MKPPVTDEPANATGNATASPRSASFRTIASHAYQSLKRDRKRTARHMAVLTLVVVQLGILSCVGRGLDTIYLQNFPSYIGTNDVVVSKTRTGSFTDVHFPDAIHYELEREVPEIISLPRLYSVADVAEYENWHGSHPVTMQFYLAGINFTREQALQREVMASRVPTSLGDFLRLDVNLEPTGEPIRETIPTTHCLITKPVAERLNVSAGDRLMVELLTGTQVLTVYAVVEIEGRFPAENTELIVCDLLWLQYYMECLHRVNVIFGVFRHPETIYELRDLKASLANLHRLSSRIEEIVGTEFTVMFPRLLAVHLTQLEIISVIVVIYAFFFSESVVLALVFYKLQRTREITDERERAFMHAIGRDAKRLVAYSWCRMLFLALPAVALGTYVGLFVTLLFVQVPFVPVLVGEIFGSALVIVAGTGLLAAVRRARAFRRQEHLETSESPTIEKASRFRRDETGLNPRGILTGAIIVSLALWLFFLLPDMIFDITAARMSQLLFVLIMSAIAGLALLLVRGLPRVTSAVTKALLWKKRARTLASFYRHSRRATNFVPLLALGCIFPLLFYSHVIQQFRTQNLVTQVVFEDGADVVLSNFGSPRAGDCLNRTVYDELASNPVVQAAAPVLYNFGHQKTYMSGVLEARVEAEQGRQDTLGSRLDFGEEFFGDDDPDGGDDGVHWTEDPAFKKYSTEVRDHGSYDWFKCGLIGVNRSLLDVVDLALALWDAETGSCAQAFHELFTTRNCCIISKQIAQELNVGTLGEPVYLEVESRETRATKWVQLRVVGVAEGIPGFVNFYARNPLRRSIPGIMVTSETYMEIEEYDSWADPALPFDKILLNLNDTGDPRVLPAFKNALFTQLAGEYEFEVTDPLAKSRYLQEGNEDLSRLVDLLSGVVAASIVFLVGTVLHVARLRPGEGNARRPGEGNSLGLPGKEPEDGSNAGLPDAREFSRGTCTYFNAAHLVASLLVFVIVGMASGIALATVSFQLIDQFTNLPSMLTVDFPALVLLGGGMLLGGVLVAGASTGASVSRKTRGRQAL